MVTCPTVDHTEDTPFAFPDLTSRTNVYRYFLKAALEGRPQDIARIHASALLAVHGYPSHSVELGQTLYGAYGVLAAHNRIRMVQADTTAERTAFYTESWNNQNRAAIIQGMTSQLETALLEGTVRDAVQRDVFLQYDQLLDETDLQG